MKHTARTAALLLLCACTAAPAPAPVADTQSTRPTESDIPYPAPDLQSQIDDMGVETARLHRQIEELQERVKRLEQTHPARTPQRPAYTPRPAAGASAADPLETARRQYAEGSYAAVVRSLKSAAAGGSGSDTDRRAMLLLLQSHRKLGNCESVIQIGSRYVSRFRNSPEAADTLFTVGQCQWDMQQRDVARDTWRKLIRLYPSAPAARKAAQHADKY
ncbi:DNA uptake lipoprotein [Kingella potus]|uniref:DNA uptake lipoprotein n=1 Tax=Kingella potus TaxID=265175 RepID=A0A377R338_9NEIS|nr:hypothetical protein [Kingella potus]UOP01050.1 hypothetical protein LVJ84_01365 [Kingella potus]STR00731.1 DNA uptake lipoprotein [Kingella potus]